MVNFSLWKVCVSSLEYKVVQFQFEIWQIYLLIISDVVDFLKGLSPSELTGIRELQRRDLLQRASIYVTMAGDNTSIDNYGKVLNVD